MNIKIIFITKERIETCYQEASKIFNGVLFSKLIFLLLAFSHLGVFVSIGWLDIGMRIVVLEFKVIVLLYLFLERPFIFP